MTSRDLLYGDAFELRAAALSMTLDEASRVLEHANHSSAGLVALADGWPAVIGLAALLPGEVKPTSDAQPALFDYVAQELFDELEPDVQKHLVLLSVPSTLTPALLRQAANVFFLVAGPEKAHAFQEVLYANADPQAYPAAGVHLDRGTLIWWIDREANRVQVAGRPAARCFAVSSVLRNTPVDSTTTSTPLSHTDCGTTHGCFRNRQ